MSEINLWLIRHGETTVNTGVWSASPNDTHLTFKGIEQAKVAASEITVQPDLIVTSPLIRAQETSQFIREKWPNAPVLIAPIQEFVYLSPQKLSELTPENRAIKISDYWLRADPHYQDAEDTESFASFLMRVKTFYNDILNQKGYIIAIGHGQFFKAFLLGLKHGFNLSSDWMSFFRHQELSEPLNNGGVIQCTLK